MPNPGRFTPGKARYPLYRRLGGSQDRSGRVRKISPPTEIRSPDRLTPQRSMTTNVERHCFILIPVRDILVEKREIKF